MAVRRSAVLGLGVAGAAVALAVLSRLAAEPMLGGRTPFLFVFPAVLITAWYAGRWPAYATLVLGTLGTFLAVPGASVLEAELVMASAAVIELTMAMRRAEQRGHHAVERLDLALATGHMGVFEWDLTTNEVWWSDSLEPVYGLPRGAFGRTLDAFRQLIHSSDRDQVDAALAQAIATRGDFEVEFRFLRPDGSIRWMSTSGRVFSDLHGRPQRTVGTSRDITAHKDAEAALKQADRRKDEFLAILAHELRNPLAPIRLALEMLRTCDGDPSLTSRAMDVMTRQLAHLVRLIDDLLDVSRITRGKLELRRSRVPLVDIVRTAVETSRPQIEAAGHELEVEVEEAPVELYADLTRIAQVISNLLNNAAKYTPRGGTIRLVARQHAGRVELQVSDNGIGLAEEDLTRVFDMFAQVGPLTTRGHGGLGIGLALARALVDMHGGQIDATSGGLGKGSTFTVQLPPAGPADARPSAPDLEIPVIQGLRVLVADDNRDAIDTLALFLERSGHTVRTASDGVEAIEAAAAFHPDVCVIDIGMPHMDGYEVARKLRADGHAPVLIALTGWGQAEDHRRSREAGFDYHLIKPVQPATLVKLLATAARAA